MLRFLKLLAPALVPSWNFFDSVGPSPRIEYALSETPEDTPQTWREFRPRPANLSFTAMLGRLFWNPRWNESLFLVSCAERFADTPSARLEQEILMRIRNDLKHGAPPQSWLRFRILFVTQDGDHLRGETRFNSDAQRLHA